jgi:hypothetical protein
MPDEPSMQPEAVVTFLAIFDARPDRVDVIGGAA